MNYQKLSAKILELSKQIVKLKSSQYDIKRTLLFGKLIKLIKENDKATNFHHKIFTQFDYKLVNELRSTFSLEQISIEKYWAKKIISSNNPYKELKSFPFYKGYVSSADYLCNAINNVYKRPITKLLYIGSGALPLNPIIMENKQKMTIKLIERDSQSYLLSRKILDTFKLNTKISVEKTDILDFKKLNIYDIIINAILVGETAVQKLKVIRHIRAYMGTKTLLVFKNVDGLRRLIYPSIKPQDFKDLKIEKVINNPSQLTNILMFFQKTVRNSS